MIALEVLGVPIPQGGLVRSPHGGLYHKRRGPLLAWRERIATEARRVMWHAELIEGPVRVRVDFRMPRPARHYLPANSRRQAAELRLDAPVYAIGKPDVDKLIRAALDALTGAVFLDDSQVVELRSSKRYGATPGATIVVERLEVTQ
jgi:crossover junction endodeoxyribonuclease RusA